MNAQRAEVDLDWQWRRWAVPVLTVALMAVALAVLHGEIAHLRYHDISAAMSRIPIDRRLAALAATGLSYAVLPGYDVLALRYVGRAFPFRRIAFASVVSYGISQTLGFPAVTGGSVRARLWSAWGLDTSEIAHAVGFAGATFSLGVIALVGLVGVSEPSAGLMRVHLPVGPLRIVSAAALTIVVLYAVWCVRRQGDVVRLRSLAVTVPSPRIVVFQLALAVIDWVCAALVLYILLPTGHQASFTAFLAAFILAQAAGVVSHVPGGLGVFETLILLQVGGTVPADAMLASLIAYRAIFYLLPFVLAVGMLAGHELHQQRTRLARATNAMSYGFGRWAEPLLPGALGLLTIIGGAVLLFSGATPPVHGRLTALVAILPLGTVELSHFAASVVGALLLVLGWALTRRLDAAYHFASILLVVGMVASLLKGLDWEEAAALGLVLSLLRASRMAFYRRASLLAEPLTPGLVRRDRGDCRGERLDRSLLIQARRVFGGALVALHGGWRRAAIPAGERRCGGVADAPLDVATAAVRAATAGSNGAGDARAGAVASSHHRRVGRGAGAAWRQADHACRTR